MPVVFFNRFKKLCHHYAAWMKPSKSDKVLERIDAIADKKFLHIISREKGRLLERLVRKHKPMLALETGTLVGYSAIRIARNLPKNGRLISIEINRNKAAEARKNIAAAGLADKVDVLVGEASKVISKMNAKTDFVFFDVADYLKCLNELEGNGCLPKGSVVVANNVKWFNSRLQPYLDHVRNSGRYKSSYLDLGFDAMEVSVKQ